MTSINNMIYNQFISNQGWISFNYPSNMISVEEEEGTYLFYTEQTGSFRVTPLKLGGNKVFDGDKYLKDQAQKNDGEILHNSNNSYVFYVSSSNDGDGPLSVYNWIFAANNKIVYCSYTVDSDRINDPEIVDEKNEVFKIIESINVK